MSLRSIARAVRNPVVSLGLAIAVVGSTGVATAATGGTFILGQSNTASSRTGLTSTAGTPLSLYAKTGYPPLAVNSETKVVKLNADKLDGVDSSALQRRVTGSCGTGAVRSVAANGGVTCAALPQKFSVAASAVRSTDPPVDTAVATVDGVAFHVRCTVVDDELDGRRLFMTGYFTGAGLANGHTLTTLYTGTSSIEPVGMAIPAAGASAALREFDAPEFAFSRQTAIVMATGNGPGSQWTLHLFADARDLSSGAKPCTVSGTVV